MIGGEFLLLPHLGAAGLDIGGRDEDLDARLAHALEIDQLDNEVL